jgi:hypothetical protein
MSVLTNRTKSVTDGFAALQSELQPLEGQRLDAAYGHELARRRFELVRRASERMTLSEVKRLQLEASDGRPLTVCDGHICR